MEGSCLGENKGYAVAIAIALVFIAAVVAGYYIWLRGSPEAYSTISLLDANGKATDYPELLLIDENNTFTVLVNVENHMRENLNFEVRVKTTMQTTPEFPVPGEAKNVYALTLENDGKWSTSSTTTIDVPGNYMIVYELWIQNENGEFEFTGNFCVLNLEVKNLA